MKAVTITVIANMTSNYSEGLGNISTVQKVVRNQRSYAIRSRESLKNALMVQSGWYDELATTVDGAVQKAVSEVKNAATCRALDAGYMNTNVKVAGDKGKATYIRKSSFFLTDAISVDPFADETRFHNNLYLATIEAKQQGLNVQNSADKVGLMPYQYEYDKSYKVYSLTIDLEQLGRDDNFNAEAPKEEKIARINALLDAVRDLNLVVKGNLDNAEPIFVVGGISPRRTHYFENVVHMKNGTLQITEDLKNKLDQGFHCGFLEGGAFTNEEEVKAVLKPQSVSAFFDRVKADVAAYYEGK